MTEERKLSQWVETGIRDSDLARQWERIENSLDGKRARFGGRGRLALALAGVVALAVAVVLVVRRPATPSAWDGAVFDSGSDQVSVALGDGSKIELSPASRVVVNEGSARSVRLDLRKGSAKFDVTHVEGRSFHVAAGGATIRVVGTRFSVDVADVPSGHTLSVSVEQGVVEVETGVGAEPVRVRAGETWRATVTKESAPPPPPEPAKPSVAGPSAEAEASPAPGRTARAAAAHTAAAAEAEPTAQDLFERGNAARRAGDPRAAATAYDALLRRYPSDGRAGLAAFELGRLEMDQLGNTAAAVLALKRAVALAPGSGFREDALARLVRAYATMGDSGQCEGAQRAYLNSYPNGVHAGAVRKACAPGR